MSIGNTSVLPSAEVAWDLIFMLEENQWETNVTVANIWMNKNVIQKTSQKNEQEFLKGIKRRQHQWAENKISGCWTLPKADDLVRKIFLSYGLPEVIVHLIKNSLVEYNE